jgi:hypothetical protein
MQSLRTPAPDWQEVASRNCSSHARRCAAGTIPAMLLRTLAIVAYWGALSTLHQWSRSARPYNLKEKKHG